MRRNLKAGAMDAFRNTIKMMRRLMKTSTRGTPYGMPRWMRSRSKYEPHNGEKEKARRIRQMRKWNQPAWLRRMQPGAALEP